MIFLGNCQKTIAGTHAPTDVPTKSSMKSPGKRKLLLILGLLALTATLIGAGFYASMITEWFTAWGRYGTALFRTWMLAPLILSACVLAAGIVVLWMEYVRED